MPLVINSSLSNSPSRMKKNPFRADSARYIFLQNFEGPNGTFPGDGIELMATCQDENNDEAVSMTDKTIDAMPSPEVEEKLLSQILTYISGEFPHRYNEDELRQVLRGNITSIVFLAGNDKTDGHLEVNIDRFQQDLSMERLSTDEDGETKSMSDGSSTTASSSSSLQGEKGTARRKRRCLPILPTGMPDSWRRWNWISERSSLSLSPKANSYHQMK
ncbi:expressed unknown protein [Seminavis robusta]|uniref:Uncharacterized protein n=1 Tax=Seminavis robusta TaxID=568900 RepID=A0A9N8E2T5_9STRA|nr:expressed unknown protein [Seminavis robusta]|eukprot:Sro499_g155040.1 n/a (217) ;mRNA; f:23583-24233